VHWAVEGLAQMDPPVHTSGGSQRSRSTSVCSLALPIGSSRPRRPPTSSRATAACLSPVEAPHWR
jgi:hypothetical protein